MRWLYQIALWFVDPELTSLRLLSPHPSLCGFSVTVLNHG